MMNTKKAKLKVSRIMRLMNYFLYSIFALQILIILVLSIVSVIWKANNKKKYYTQTSETLAVTVNFGTWIIQLLTYWVAYSHMIPISLYVMIEVLKLFLGKLISNDEEMRDKDTNAMAEVRNSDLIEELG
jgi:phospholipid-transporting ATPase